METAEAKFREIYEIMNSGYYYQILKEIPSINELVDNLIKKSNVLFHKTERIKVMMQTTANSLQRKELPDSLLNSKIEEVERETQLYNTMSSELYNEIETLYNKVIECVNKNEKPELPLSVETAHELINKQTNEIISLSNEKLQYDNKINELEKEIKELKVKIDQYEAKTAAEENDEGIEIEKKIRWLEKTELLYKDLFNIKEYSMVDNHLVIHWNSNYQLDVYFNDNDTMTNITLTPSLFGDARIILKCRNTRNITLLLNEIQYLITCHEYLMTTLAKLQTLYNCNIDYEESTDQLHVTTNTTGLYVDIQLPRGYPQSFSPIHISKIENLLNDSDKNKAAFASLQSARYIRLDELFKAIFDIYKRS